MVGSSRGYPGNTFSVEVCSVAICHSESSEHACGIYSITTIDLIDFFGSWKENKVVGFFAFSVSHMLLIGYFIDRYVFQHKHTK